jgi:copper ion binding protein
MSTVTWQVTGMTCKHCVAAVGKEVGALPGVQAVDVDLPTGTVAVTAEQQPSREQIEAAVDEAGYALA